MYWFNWVTACNFLCKRPIGALVTNWNAPGCRCLPCVHHFRCQYRSSLLSLPCLRQPAKGTLWHFIWLEKVPDMWGSFEIMRDPMKTPASHSEFLKWMAAALLAVTMAGVIAMAYWLPVKRYTVTCTKLQSISCQLQRETSSDHPASQVELGRHPTATVKIQPVRRGSPRVFLYLSSTSDTFFAAEFEGGAAETQARTAAAELNQFFSSGAPSSVRVMARTPAYLTWMLWGAIGFLGMFVLVIYRELFGRKRRPDE